MPAKSSERGGGAGGDRERLPITCGKLSGTLVLREPDFTSYVVCEDGARCTPRDFERKAGMGSRKKWKTSFLVRTAGGGRKVTVKRWLWENCGRPAVPAPEVPAAEAPDREDEPQPAAGRERGPRTSLAAASLGELDNVPLCDYLTALMNEAPADPDPAARSPGTAETRAVADKSSENDGFFMRVFYNQDWVEWPVF